jgi:hypothetical protein
MLWKSRTDQARYTSLPTSSPVREQQHQVGLEKQNDTTATSRTIISRRAIQAIFSAVIISLVFTFAYNYSHDHHPLTEKFDTCGLSASSALSHGCSFDITSFAWLPARCFDPGLVEQFLALRDWRWYLDAEGSQPIDLGSVRSGGHAQLYVTQEYHIYHCTYMWRKMHRAAAAGRPLDGYIGDIAHTAHCEGQLVGHGAVAVLNETNTVIFTKFVNCPRDGEDLGDKGWYRVVDGRPVFSSFGHHH